MVDQAFTDLVVERKIPPMALRAGLWEVKVRALEALGMGGDYPQA
jgi:hypothetical protein